MAEEEGGGQRLFGASWSSRAQFVASDGRLPLLRLQM